MRDESARARIDVARARVPSLLAVAHLTLGDPGRARAVTTAAVADALGHPAPEDSQPAQHLRDALVVALFREIAPARGSTATAPPWSLAGPGHHAAGADLDADPHLDAGAEPEEAGEAAVLRHLRDSSAMERLTLGLVEFEDLGPDQAGALLATARTRHTESPPDPQATLERARAAVAASGSPVPVSLALRRLLDRVQGSDPESVVDDAVALVGARRRRRLRLLGLAGATAAAIVGVVALSVVAPQEPAPRPSARSTLPAAPGSIVIDGVRVTLGVPVSAEGSLPPLPGAVEDTALPPRLAIPEGEITPLTAAVLAGRSVRAVLVRRLPDGTGRAVLYVPRGAPEYVEVTDVTLPPPTPGEGTVGPRTISDDRHRIVLHDTAGIAIVDTDTATVTRIPVALDGTELVGWAQGSSLVVVESLHRPYRIDPATGDVQPMAPPGGVGRERIIVDQLASVLRFDRRGVVTGQRELPGPLAGVLGPTATSQTGWSAAGAVYSSQLIPAGASKGLYAVSFDLSASAAALVVRPEDRVTGECCRVLGWAPQDRVLHLAPAPDALRILAFDVNTGAQYLVSTIPAPGTPGWWGEFAL